MKTNSNYHRKEEERLLSLIELIVDDLKARKYIHNLSLRGQGSSFSQLQLHDEIFSLVGIQKQKIDDSLLKWYSQMTEKVYAIDVFQEEEKLLSIAAEILVVLNGKRFE